MIFNRLMVTKLVITSLLILLQSFTTAQANTVLNKKVLQGISSEEAEEFNRQYNLEYKKHKGDLSVWNTLSFMLNPYLIIIVRHNYGESRTEKLSKIEVNLIAKQYRFDECQHKTTAFLIRTSEARALTSKEGMSKHDYLRSLSKEFDLTYPFTTITSNYPLDIINQFFIKMVWKYRGKGKENVTVFFNACLSIPIKIFEDDIRDELKEE